MPTDRRALSVACILFLYLVFPILSEGTESCVREEACRCLVSTRSQLRRIVEGGARNHQIYGGRAATEVVRRLIAKNKSKVNNSLVREFEERVASWG